MASAQNGTSPVLMLVPRPIENSPLLLVASSLLGSIAFILILLKAVERALGTHILRAEDITLLLAFLSAVGFSTACCLAVYRYGGTHIIPEAPYAALAHNALCNWIAGVCHHISITCTKMSLVLFYRRVFNHFKFRILADILWIGTGLFGLGYLLFYCLQCRPVNFYWMRFTGLTDGHCVQAKDALLSVGIVSVVLDVLVLILPLRVFWTISHPTKEKLMIVLLFLVGMAACIAAILRTYYLQVALYSTGEKAHQATLLFWFFITMEAYLGICCACLPTVRALVVRKRGVEEKKRLQYMANSDFPSNLDSRRIKPRSADDLASLREDPEEE